MKNSKAYKLNIPLVVLFSVLTVGGLVSGITGFILAGMSMNDPNSFPSMEILFIVGFVVFSLSFVALFITLVPFLIKKMNSVTAPITKEYIQEVGIPTVDMLSKTSQICPECQAENPPAADYCSKCGHKLNKVCPECNTKNDASNEYCNHCGKKL